MAAVGCYSLDLYCDNWKGARDDVHGWGNGFPHQYTDEFGSACRAQARKDGWLIRGDGYALCPKCSGKKRQARKPHALDACERVNAFALVATPEEKR